MCSQRLKWDDNHLRTEHREGNQPKITTTNKIETPYETKQNRNKDCNFLLKYLNLLVIAGKILIEGNTMHMHRSMKYTYMG